MKKNTALSVLYNRCKWSIDIEPKDPTEREIGYSICLQHMMRIMDKSLFDLERDQIVNAWCDGVEDEPMSRIRAEEYFNKTYITEK